MRINVYDPFPGKFESSGAGHFGHKPTSGHWGHALAYYSWTKGPIGLIDPGNAVEARYWAQKVGWKGAGAVTFTRATFLPIAYGFLADPDHVRRGGWDDSYMAFADDRRRRGGSPFSYSDGVMGSPGAWSWSNRSV